MKVAVIGAGAAGLCCARHFGQFPSKFLVEVFEQTARIGGTWVYAENTGKDDYGLPVHSSMYKSLRTNLPKQIMAFPDFPFSENLPSFPYHSDVLHYLQRYAEHHNLSRLIKFRTLVEKVVPVKRDLGCGVMDTATSTASNGVWTSTQSAFPDRIKWMVTVREVTTGDRETKEFDAVLVCNGHFFTPFTPDIRGLHNFPGAVTHSHSYREPRPFRGQSVLVVGAGQSGRDIILDVSQEARSVYLCNRGAPVLGDLPSNIEQLPSIDIVEKDGTVSFTNNEKRHVDSIILCTGYDYTFPFLTDECGIRVEDRRIISLYKHTFNSLYPSMAFMGVNFRVVPFPYFDLQVRWILSVWSGEKHLPSTAEMAAASDLDYRERLEKGFPLHHAHRLGPLQWDFYRELAEMSGRQPLDPVLQMLYEETSEKRTTDLTNYKNAEFKIIGRDKWTRIDTENHK